MKSAQDKAFRAADRIPQIRQQIAAGAYETPKKLDIAADRLLDDIIPQVPATCAAQHRMDDLGVCRLCGKPMRRGQRLYHDEYSSDDKARVHGACADEKAEARR